VTAQIQKVRRLRILTMSVVQYRFIKVGKLYWLDIEFLARNKYIAFCPSLHSNVRSSLHAGLLLPFLTRNICESLWIVVTWVCALRALFACESGLSEPEIRLGARIRSFDCHRERSTTNGKIRTVPVCKNNCKLL
jgi:hypothetical protein